MREPLAITGANIVAHNCAIEVSELRVETGVPTTHAVDMVAGQITDVADRAAKARWANHGAIGARQAAVGNLRPTRMFQVTQQQVANVGRIQMFCNLLDGLLPSRFGAVEFRMRGGACGQLGQDFGPFFTADFDGKGIG